MLKKKFKKSSVALLLGFALLGGSVTAFAATGDESYWETLALSNVKYDLNTSDRTSTQLYYAKMAYTRTNCAEATVAFHIYSDDYDKTVTSIMYLTDRRDNWEYMDYSSEDILKKGSMTLRAKTASSHTGYYVAGMFYPNGQ